MEGLNRMSRFNLLNEPGFVVYDEKGTIKVSLRRLFINAHQYKI